MSTTNDTTKLDMLSDGWELNDGNETVVLTFPDLDVMVRLDKSELVEATDLIRATNAVDYCSVELDRAHDAGRAEAIAEVDFGGVRRALEDWHNANHESVLRFCYLEPCKPIRDALEHQQ